MALANNLPTGAYIIRNKKTSTVLHIERHQEAQSSVQAWKQDENLYKDQQIWWVEPLAHHGGDVLIYSITNPGTGRSLEMVPRDGRCSASKQNGESWQRWKLLKVEDEGPITYNISSVFNSQFIDIAGRYPNPRARVHGWSPYPKYDKQCWEFIVPVVAFPAGWFQFQNVKTGQLLRHDYDYNAPTLSPAPDCPAESQYRESWAFQWALAHSKYHSSGSTTEANSWYVVNRLTRVRLSPYVGNREAVELQVPDTALVWRMELDRFINWKIINWKTGCLLQASGAEMPAVVCSEKVFSEDDSQTWTLKSPELYNGDAPPPEYNA